MSDRIQEILTELDSTDQIVVRFMEDILVALLNKQAISLADVPRVAVQKILHRRRLRCELKQLKGGGQYVENFSQHQRGVYMEGLVYIATAGVSVAFPAYAATATVMGFVVSGAIGILFSDKPYEGPTVDTPITGMK